MIRQKEISLARHSGYRFGHWLLAACLLTGSAFLYTTANAAVTVLATNQGTPGNIIVDGSRVYWIDQNTAKVSSVNKLSTGGSSVLVNSPAATADTTYVADLVQDTSFLYFLRNETWGNSIFKASKISTSVSRIVDEQAEADSLGINNGILYFYSDQQWENTPQKWDGIPGQGFPNFDRRIGRVSTQGGSITTVFSSAISGIDINPVYFSTDGTYLNWSDLNLQAIARIGFLGGSVLEPVTGISSPWALTTPTTSPASGYIFWTEQALVAGAPKYLKRIKPPGTVPLALINGVSDPVVRCFVQVNSFVYCAMATSLTATGGTITRVPIDGGTPVVVVNALDANGPLGLASDGQYLFWTAGDGSIRRVALAALPPPSTPAASAATNVTSSGFTANWSSVSNATGYRLDVSTSSSFTSYVTWDVGNVTSRSNGGLSANTIYYYRVRAYNSGGTSGNSNVISAKTLALVRPLASIANAATKVFGSWFTGNWSAVSGATGYLLDVSTTSSFISYVSGYQNRNVGNVISQSVTGLSASKAYYYRVRAYNGAGTSGNSNVIPVTTSSITPAQMLSPTPGSSGSNGSTFTSSTVTFSWSAGISVTEYLVDVGNSLGASDIYGASQGLNHSHTVSNIPTDGRTIYVRLLSKINGVWQSPLDYMYKAFKVAPAPNLIPYAPSGWSNKIVTTHTYGSTTDTSSLVVTSPIYIDWAVANLGVSNVTTAFRTNLYVDNLLRTYFTISYTVPANYWTGYTGYSIGLLSHGSHTIKITTDSTNQVSESNEGDNAYTKTIFVN